MAKKKITKVKETKWYESKTVWFNVIVAVLGIVDVLTPLNLVPVQYLTAVALIGNVLIRVFITGSSIERSIK